MVSVHPAREVLPTLLEEDDDLLLVHEDPAVAAKHGASTGTNGPNGNNKTRAGRPTRLSAGRLPYGRGGGAG